MSTPAVVEVDDGSAEGKAYLYRHSDGYPSSMIPFLQKCFTTMEGLVDQDRKNSELYRESGYKIDRPDINWQPSGERIYPESWKNERAGYVAGEICAMAPFVVQVEEAKLVGDLTGEYLYVLRVGQAATGSADKVQPWTVEVRLGGAGGKRKGRAWRAAVPLLEANPADEGKEARAGHSVGEPAVMPTAPPAGPAAPTGPASYLEMGP